MTQREHAGMHDDMPARIITVAAAEHSIENDFAEALPAAISGYVFVDYDDDGIALDVTSGGPLVGLTWRF